MFYERKDMRKTTGSSMKNGKLCALTLGEGMTRSFLCMRNMRVALVGAVAMVAVVGHGANLYFSPPAEDTNLCWDNAAGWKTSNGVVNRLPTMTDEVTLDSSRIALAGTGVDTPHALRITNGVKAEAYSFKIASVDAASTASYANSGRVIGVQIDKQWKWKDAPQIDLGDPNSNGWRRGVVTVRVPKGATRLGVFASARLKDGEMAWFDNFSIVKLR